MKNITLILAIAFAFTTQSCSKDKSKSQEISANSADSLNENRTVTELDSLQKNPAKKAALLFDIEGNYKVKEAAENCKMDLKLYYLNGILKYNLTTDRRTISDNAKIELNEEKNGYYITFENIEWSENEGALNNEGEPIEKDVVLPKEIQGTLSKNEITIQNTGNAMNYYVKIGECEEKYIQLKKENPSK